MNQEIKDEEQEEIGQEQEEGLELDLRRMTVKGLILDSKTEMPIVILQDAEKGEEGAFLPIWIGLFEANAIATELEGIPSPRPMTHDLLVQMIRELDAEVVRIVISHLNEGTFHAQVVVRQEDRERSVDARPSDSVAVALRTKAPIFVSEQVLDDAGSMLERDDEKAKKWLEEVDPEELGKYTM